MAGKQPSLLAVKLLLERNFKVIIINILQQADLHLNPVSFDLGNCKDLREIAELIDSFYPSESR
jgi:hypothetical protein